MRKRAVLVAIGLSLVHTDSLPACTAADLAFDWITGEMKSWPCNTTVRYWQSSSDPLPQYWLGRVGSAAIAWDAETGKIGIAPLSGSPGNPPTNTVPRISLLKGRLHDCISQANSRSRCSNRQSGPGSSEQCVRVHSVNDSQLL